jgi:hypothetical protein
MDMAKIFMVLAGLLLSGGLLAQSDPRSQAEIRHLLDFVEQSGCDFNRNGKWYPPREARAHLGKKYDYLERRGLAPDAERFIERAASQSSISGRAYQVRCGDSKPVASERWLQDELSRYRKEHAVPGGQ